MSDETGRALGEWLRRRHDSSAPARLGGQNAYKSSRSGAPGAARPNQKPRRSRHQPRCCRTTCTIRAIATETPKASSSMRPAQARTRQPITSTPNPISTSPPASDAGLQNPPRVRHGCSTSIPQAHATRATLDRQQAQGVLGLRSDSGAVKTMCAVADVWSWIGVCRSRRGPRPCVHRGAASAPWRPTPPSAAKVPRRPPDEPTS
jgi:hypothetical protein